MPPWSSMTLMSPTGSPSQRHVQLPYCCDGDDGAGADAMGSAMVKLGACESRHLAIASDPS